MQAIGYRHMQPVIEGRETLAQVLAAMQRDTRQFARRQRTWHRRVPEAVWVDPDDTVELEARVGTFLAAGADVEPQRPAGTPGGLPGEARQARARGQ